MSHFSSFFHYHSEKGYSWNQDLDPENLDSEKPGPWKTWNLKNLEPEKPGPWNTWNLKNLNLEKHGKRLGMEKWLEDHIL